MGECKESLKTVTDKGKKLLSKLKKNIEPTTTVESFTDTLADLDDSLGKLISIKEKDYSNEKGSEEENSKKLALLKTMQFHLDSIVNQINDYINL